MKRYKLSRYIAVAFLTGLLVLPAVTGVAQKSHDNAVNRNLSIFNSIVKELEMNYVDTIRTDETFKKVLLKVILKV